MILSRFITYWLGDPIIEITEKWKTREALNGGNIIGKVTLRVQRISSQPRKTCHIKECLTEDRHHGEHIRETQNHRGNGAKHQQKEEE